MEAVPFLNLLNLEGICPPQTVIRPKQKVHSPDFNPTQDFKVSEMGILCFGSTTLCQSLASSWLPLPLKPFSGPNKNTYLRILNRLHPCKVSMKSGIYISYFGTSTVCYSSIWKVLFPYRFPFQIKKKNICFSI